MSISKLHLMLIDCYEKENYTTKELKRILDVEENKIRNYTRELLDIFKVRNISELREVQKNDINWRLKIKEKVTISKEDRKKYILLKFVKQNVINLTDISREMDITRRSLSIDLEDLKDEVQKFGVTISSLSSKGIELRGIEENKKELFVINLLKLFMERNYMPTIFDDFFQEFDEVINESIERFVYDIIETKGVLKQTYIHLHLEIFLYIGILRNNKDANFRNLEYELKRINQICEVNRKKNLMKNYKDDHYIVDHLIDYIEEKTEFKIERAEEVYLIVYSRLKIIDFKKENKLKEIYLINKNFEKTYKKFFDFFVQIIENYFEDKIDSLDKISFFLSFTKFLSFKKEINKKSQGKTIVLYNFFQRQLINLYLKDIEEKIKINIDDVISIYAIKKYLEENNLKKIILLEDIDLKFLNLSLSSIEIIQINFPMSEIDYIKI